MVGEYGVISALFKAPGGIIGFLTNILVSGLKKLLFCCVIWAVFKNNKD